MTELPAVEAALLDAAKRRFGRPRLRYTAPRVARRAAAAAAIAALATAAVIVLVSPATNSDPTGTDERPATGHSERWTTTVNSKYGFEVSLPSTWQLSTETLTPRLTDPREVLSAGTFPLAFGKGSCSHVPAGALQTMGSADGFVSVQERGRAPGSSWSDFPPRPEHFADEAVAERGDIAGCLGDRPGLLEFWLPFTDAGRHFYAMVVLGADAPPQVRTQAFEVLDSLRFDPAVQPSWRASD
jgi:hypothetical protein